MNKHLSIKVRAIDHVVLTVADIDQTIDFYTWVLVMKEETLVELSNYL